MRNLAKVIRHLRHNEQGATALEYAFIAALLVMGILVSMRSALTASVNMWTMVSNTLQTATN